GPVAGDDHALAVKDAAARRRDEAEIELVVDRQGGVFARLNHLKLAQAAAQRQQPQGRGAAQQEGAAQERALALIDVRKEDRRFAAHRKRTSPSSKRSSIQPTTGNRARVGTTCQNRAKRLGALPA